MEPRQDEAGGADTTVQELTKQCELLQAATMLARNNAVEAYKVAIAGGAGAIDPASALVQYQTAKSLQQFAEQALLTYLQARSAVTRLR
jgi:hypothetical protein